MNNNSYIFLDFSSENVLFELQTLIETFSEEHVFYSALKFSLDWLKGETDFEFSTSGSTGVPKKMVVSRERIIASVTGTARFFDLKKGEKALVCLNPIYSGGKMMLARALHIGMHISLIEPSNLALSVFENEKFDLVSVVPSQLYTLLQQKEGKQRFVNYKNMIVGGAAVSLDLIQKLTDVENCAVYESFGMTETLSHIALKKISGAGKQTYFTILPNVEIKTTPESCLMVKASMTNNEWIFTNDVVELKNEKYFKYIGRIDNVINSGGVKMYPEEIEELLIPILQESGYKGAFFLFGLDEDKLGQKMVLVLEGVLNCNENSLLNKMKSELPKFHSPVGIVNMEQFYRTQSGKIIRKIEV